MGGSRRVWRLWLVALVVAPVALPSAAADHHDACVFQNGGPDAGDAGNVWLSAFPLPGPISCAGQMRGAHPNLDPDDHDWYFYDPAPEQVLAPVTVRLCPQFAIVAPWETGFSLYFLPAGIVVPSFGEPPGSLVPIVESVEPGLLQGSSGEAGCDEITASLPGASLGRWYVHVARESGDGEYLLTVV